MQRNQSVHPVYSCPQVHSDIGVLVSLIAFVSIEVLVSKGAFVFMSALVSITAFVSSGAFLLIGHLCP